MANIFGKIKKILTVITDLLLIGRGKGWWSERPTVPKEKKNG